MNRMGRWVGRFGWKVIHKHRDRDKGTKEQGQGQEQRDRDRDTDRVMCDQVT